MVELSFLGVCRSPNVSDVAAPGFPTEFLQLCQVRVFEPRCWQSSTFASGTGQGHVLSLFLGLSLGLHPQPVPRLLRALSAWRLALRRDVRLRRQERQGGTCRIAYVKSTEAANKKLKYFKSPQATCSSASSHKTLTSKVSISACDPSVPRVDRLAQTHAAEVARAEGAQHDARLHKIEGSWHFQRSCCCPSCIPVLTPGRQVLRQTWIPP